MVSMPLLGWEVVDRPNIGRAEMRVTPSLTSPPHPHLLGAAFLLLGSVVPWELMVQEGELQGEQRRQSWEEGGRSRLRLWGVQDTQTPQRRLAQEAPTFIEGQWV